MFGYHTKEEKNKFVIFSVVGTLATLALAGILFGVFAPGRNNIGRNNDAEGNTEASEQKKAAAVSEQYIVALNNLLAEINNLPAEIVVEKSESTLLSMRVPKEMLDKHLPAVFAVAKLKEEKDAGFANEQVRKIVGDLLIEAGEIK